MSLVRSQHEEFPDLMPLTTRTILFAYAVITVGKVQFTYIVGSATAKLSEWNRYGTIQKTYSMENGKVIVMYAYYARDLPIACVSTTFVNSSWWNKLEPTMRRRRWWSKLFF